MQKTDPLIRTEIRLPFTRPEVFPRPWVQAPIAQRLRSPLTLIATPAGSGDQDAVASKRISLVLASYNFLRTLVVYLAVTFLLEARLARPNLDIASGSDPSPPF
jgi:ATP/maltotriose-dependent transcriptional regulator MalT